jgi:hypothetical protein
VAVPRHPELTPQRPQTKAQASFALRSCSFVDLLKYNRGKLQYGSSSYPPSQKISLQIDACAALCCIRSIQVRLLIDDCIHIEISPFQGLEGIKIRKYRTGISDMGEISRLAN